MTVASDKEQWFKYKYPHATGQASPPERIFVAGNIFDVRRGRGPVHVDYPPAVK
jgi:hypothetical protein